MIISGGIGHSTTFLYAAIAKHPRYHTIPTTGRAEAAIGGYRPSILADPGRPGMGGRSVNELRGERPL